MKLLSSKTLFFIFLTLFFNLISKCQAPAITSFFPTNGKPGDIVTIFGLNFNSTPTNNIVAFGTIKATVNSGSSTSLTVTVPNGAKYAPISVLNTSTQLYAESNSLFIPVSSVLKASIGASDFATRVDLDTIGTNINEIKIADFDSDGKMDIAVSSAFGVNGISIFRNISTPSSISFAPTQVIPFSEEIWGLVIGDIDGDGRPDFVTYNYADSIVFFKNTSTNGSISFVKELSIKVVGDVPSALSDMDGDGKLDLVSCDEINRFISIFKNNSSGGAFSFSTPFHFSTGSGNLPIDTEIVDLDGDSKKDIVVSHEGGRFSIFRNTSTLGNISLATKQDFISSGSHPYFSLKVGDLDGDGKIDIAIPNSTGAGGTNAHTVNIFRNTSTIGNINFAARQNFATDFIPGSLSIGDLNGDGKLDLVTGNFPPSFLCIGLIYNSL